MALIQAGYGVQYDEDEDDLEGGTLMERPRVYIVEGMGDDAFKPNESYESLNAALSDFCHVRHLFYDESKFHCTTLSSLAAFYKRAILDDVEQSWQDAAEHIVIVGYAFGAVVAHEIALQFEEVGTEVALVVLDSEVTWSPGETFRRLGGYKWLGSEVEATFMMMRAMGAKDFVEEHVRRLLHMRQVTDEAIDELKMYAFWEQAQRGGFMLVKDFTFRISERSKHLQKMMNIVRSMEKAAPEVFDGDAILMSSTESPEFAQAFEINRKYCSQLQIERSHGTHYNMFQGERVLNLISNMRHFMARRGYLGVSARQAIARQAGLMVVRNGDGPAIYIVHDSSDDPYGANGLGTIYKSMGSSLAPCRLAVLAYDKEAEEHQEMKGLAELYNMRIMRDIFGRACPIVLVGYSLGASLAYEMARRMESNGVQVKLVLIDSEMGASNLLTNQEQE